MKKAISTVLSAIMVMTLLLSLAACSGGGDAFSGTWEGESGGMISTWNFNGSGVCTLKNTVVMEDDDDFVIDLSGTYVLDEEAGTVTINMELWDSEKVYEYAVDGTTLTMEATDYFSPDYTLTKK